MPDTTAHFQLSPPADRWLLAVSDDSACGADLEYDPEFLELAQAASGKPASQFGPGTLPNWVQVRELSESLFARTRDLRVALLWARAKINIEGFAALPAALALLHGLLEGFWDELHPTSDPDDRDTARLSVVGGLDKLDSLLGDVRNATLSSDPRLHGLRMRDVELALDKLAPGASQAPHTQGQIAGTLFEAPEAAEALNLQATAATNGLDQLQTLMETRFSPDVVVDLTTLRTMLACVQAVLPAGTAVGAGEDAGSGTSEPVAALMTSRATGGVHSVDSRKDAIRAIELVCAYLERSEPTNPAQLLLRRASRVIDKNFLELVRDLAPDAVKDVARIMGVDPSAIDGER
jgi:type VI secretion system protein ImpA